MTGIRVLARRLNMSIGTVSRALNGKPGVNAETRKRVIAMAQATGYVPNAAGSNLRKGRTQTIGLMIRTGPTSLGAEKFFLAVSDAMQEVLAGHNIDLALLPIHGAMDPVAYLRRMLQRGAMDGLILTSTEIDDERIALLAASSLPFMTLGRSSTPGDYMWMDLDFEQGARKAVTRLAELGHRRIAVCVPEGKLNLSQLYRETWRQTMAENGLPASDDISFSGSSCEDGGAEVAARLLALPDRPTAIIMCSEPMISGFCGGLMAANLRPGTDLSIIGLRQSSLLRHLKPPISCFELCLTTLGRDLANAMLALTYRINADPMPTSRLIPMTYVETASVQQI